MKRFNLDQSPEHFSTEQSEKLLKVVTLFIEKTVRPLIASIINQSTSNPPIHLTYDVVANMRGYDLDTAAGLRFFVERCIDDLLGMDGEPMEENGAWINARDILDNTTDAELRAYAERYLKAA